MPELLIEVGFEEMPAPWLPGLMEQMRQRFDELARAEHLDPSGTVVLSTPRRLVLRSTLAARQADREERLWGPSVKVARDAAGKWTGAAQGFARKSGVGPDDLQVGRKDPASADEHLFSIKKTAGRAAGDVAPAVIGSLLRALAFPRRMSWDAWLDDGKGAFPFGRPIRWLVALLDGEVAPFVIHALVAGAKGEPIVQAGRVTYGHRFLPRGAAGKPIDVSSFADLQAKLAGASVILDPEARAARIREGLAKAGVPEGADDHGLVEEWRHLVEYPTVVAGTIPTEFHGLPREVLETVLVHHQKYVPVVEGGKVTRFAALTNTDETAAPQIVQGMERVVVARLRDAAFFFREDGKRALADRLDDLKGVTFHRDLGTYRDKADRMAALVEGPMKAWLTEAERSAALEAARVAKADLTTLMVREFPELQGVMGALYLGTSSPRPVATAVRWHYHPVSVEEGSTPAHDIADAPASRVFAAVAVADKIDTLAGYFGLGLAPTGSSDPFGLRRAGQGAIRAVLDFWPEGGGGRPNLRAIAEAAVAGYEGKRKKTAAEAARDVAEFLLERLRFVLTARGFAADEVDAALAARDPEAIDDPQEALARVRALHRVRLEAAEDFDHLAMAFKRARNILAGQAPAAVDQDLLGEAAERDLFDAVARLGAVDGGYEARLRSLAGLRAPVDRFFDDVMVMAEDPKVRANRLGLLQRTVALFYRIADISKLGG